LISISTSDILKILKKEKVGFSFCFDVSAPRNAGQTFFMFQPCRFGSHDARMEKTVCRVPPTVHRFYLCPVNPFLPDQCAFTV
jgi:hypothetical protein